MGILRLRYLSHLYEARVFINISNCSYNIKWNDNGCNTVHEKIQERDLRRAGDRLL